MRAFGIFFLIVGIISVIVGLLLLFPLIARAVAAPVHPWLGDATSTRPLSRAIAPPKGFERTRVAPKSFAAWLRALPVKPAGSPVLLHNGKQKWLQSAHTVVIDIDTGTRDLQQCADAVMRLRAEYLLHAGRAREINFNDTGAAKPMSFAKWANGYRPRLRGKQLTWSRRARNDSSYASFRRYIMSYSPMQVHTRFPDR